MSLKTKVFFAVFLLSGFYLWNKSPDRIHNNSTKTQKKPLNRQEAGTSHNSRKDRLKERSQDLHLEQNIQYQNTYKEHLNQEVSPEEKQHTGSRQEETYFPEDHNRRAVVKDLTLHLPEENHEDPENTIRRQLAHQQQTFNDLKEKNKKEQTRVLENFVKQAKEQGYSVYFQKDGKVLLQPIEETEEPETW